MSTNVGVMFTVGVNATELEKLKSLSSIINAATNQVNSSVNRIGAGNAFGTMAVDSGLLEQRLNRLGLTASFVGTVAFRAMRDATSALSSEMRFLGKEFIDINEKFGNLEITLSSTIKSFSAARDITRELSRMTARSPLPFQDLAKTIQSFSISPTTSGKLLQQSNAGTLGIQGGFLDRSIKLVEAMNVFRPDQSADDALFAIREALGGQTRSLIRRFDVPSRLLATYSGGKNIDVLKNDSDAMFDAMYSMFTSIISPEAISRFARQPSKLAANMREQMIDIPLFKIGQEENNASPYQAALTAAQSFYDQLVEVTKTGGVFDKKYLPRLRASLTDLIDGVGASVGSAFDKLADAFGADKSDNRFERFFSLITLLAEKVTSFTKDLAVKLADADILTNAVKFISSLVEFATQLIQGFVGLAEATSPQFASLVALSIPIVLSNIGSIMIFFQKMGDSFSRMREVSKFAAAEALKTQAEEIKNRPRSALLKSASTRFDWLDANAGSPSEGKQDAYAKSLKQALALNKHNPAAVAALDSSLFNGTKRDWATDLMRQDYRFLRDNPAQAMALKQLGLVPNNFAGAAAASSHILARYRPDFDKYTAAAQAELDAATATPKGAGVLSRTGTMLGQGVKAFGGAALSIAGGMAATGAVMLAVEGGIKLYEALTANTRAIEESTKRYEETVRAAQTEVTSSASYKAAAQLGMVNGADIDAYVRQGQKQVAAITQLVGNADSLAKEGKLNLFGGLRMDANYGSSKAAFATAFDEYGSTQDHRQLREAIKIGEQENMFATYFGSEWKLALEGMVNEAGPLSTVGRKRLQEAMSKSIPETFNTLIDILAKEGTSLSSGMAERVKEMSRASIQKKTSELHEMLVKQFTEENVSLIESIASGVLPVDKNSILGKMERISGAEKLRSISADAANFSKMSVVSSSEDAVESFLAEQNPLYNITAPLEALTVRGKELSDTVKGAIAEASKVSENFDKSKQALSAYAASLQAGGNKALGDKLLDMVSTFDVAFQKELKEKADFYTEEINRLSKGTGNKEQIDSYQKSLDAVRSQMVNLPNEIVKMLEAQLPEIQDIRTNTTVTQLALHLQKNVGSVASGSTPEVNRFGSELSAMFAAAGDVVDVSKIPSLAAVNASTQTLEEMRITVLKNMDALGSYVDSLIETAKKSASGSRNVQMLNYLRTNISNARTAGGSTQAKELFDIVSSLAQAGGGFVTAGSSTSMEADALLRKHIPAADARSRMAYAYDPEGYIESRGGNSVGTSNIVSLLEDLRKNKLVGADGELNKKIVDLIEQLKENARVTDLQREAMVRAKFTGEGLGDGFTAARSTDKRVAAMQDKYGINTSIQAQARMADYSVLYENSMGGATKSVERQLAVLTDVRSKLNETNSTLAERNAYDAELNALLVKQAQLRERASPKGFFMGFAEGASQSIEQLTNMAELGGKIGQMFSSSMGDAFANIVTGAKSAKDAFADMARSMLKWIAELLMRQAVAGLVTMAMNAWMGSSSSGGAGTSNGVDFGAGGSQGFINQGMATGGPVIGGSGYRDDVPALLMGGEYVLNKKAVAALGGFDVLDKLNNAHNEIPRFADGGGVGNNPIAYSGASARQSNVSVVINVDKNSKASAKVEGMDEREARKFAADIETLIDSRIGHHTQYGGLIHSAMR